MGVGPTEATAPSLLFVKDAGKYFSNSLNAASWSEEKGWIGEAAGRAPAVQTCGNSNGIKVKSSIKKSSTHATGVYGPSHCRFQLLRQDISSSSSRKNNTATVSQSSSARKDARWRKVNWSGVRWDEVCVAEGKSFSLPIQRPRNPGKANERTHKQTNKQTPWRKNKHTSKQSTNNLIIYLSASQPIRITHKRSIKGALFSFPLPLFIGLCLGLTDLSFSKKNLRPPGLERYSNVRTGQRVFKHSIFILKISVENSSEGKGIETYHCT